MMINHGTSNAYCLNPRHTFLHESIEIRLIEHLNFLLLTSKETRGEGSLSILRHSFHHVTKRSHLNHLIMINWTTVSNSQVNSFISQTKNNLSFQLDLCTEPSPLWFKIVVQDTWFLLDF